MAVRSGPKLSRKHQAPMVGRPRWGRVRCTFMARTPPNGTSRSGQSWRQGPDVPAAAAGGQSSSAGATSKFVTVPL